MKKKLIIFAICFVLLISGAVAYGAADDDALISLSFLQGVFRNQLKTTIDDEVDSTLQMVKQGASDTLDKLGQSYLEKYGNSDHSDWNTSSSLTSLSGVSGNTLTLAAGSGLQWRSGSAKISSGILVDVTIGSEVSAGGALVAYHRYVASKETEVLLAGNSYWSVEGQWKTNATGTAVPEPAPAAPMAFKDVIVGAWYYDGVAFVVQHGLFEGVSPTKFDLTSSMDRGMLVTVLHRFAGSPDTVYSTMYTDVKNGAWYASGAIWAAQTGVASGYSDGSFKPTLVLGRQDIALMLYNYANYVGYDTSKRDGLSAFPDAGDTASWARDAVSWCVAVGIIQGSDGKLIPADTATRAQVAIMLQRFYNLLA